MYYMMDFIRTIKLSNVN